MTAKEFIKKFPEQREINSNCLTDIACPLCGNRDSIIVSVNIWTELSDDGTDHYSDATDHCGNVEYDDGSCAQCTGEDCEMSGRLKQFRIEGLDALLQEMEGK